jgi:YfiH family protein
MILPTSSGSFSWVDTPSGPALVCDRLRPFVRHLFTTRVWPLGVPTSGDDTANGWRAVADAAGVDADRLVRVHQVHGAAADVWRAGAAPRSAPGRAGHEAEADIIVSDDPRRALAVKVADCVPLLLADRRSGAVAAAHAGWRGLAAGVPRVAVETLARECGSEPGDLVAAVGPCIGACCYEVGREVRDRFSAAGFGDAAITRWFTPAPARLEGNPPMPGLPAPPRLQHWYFDAWSATRDLLETAGVPADAVHIAALCTASHPSVFCSYRRDGRGAGRLVAVIRGAALR